MLVGSNIKKVKTNSIWFSEDERWNWEKKSKLSKGNVSEVLHFLNISMQYKLSNVCFIRVEIRLSNLEPKFLQCLQDKAISKVKSSRGRKERRINIKVGK